MHFRIALTVYFAVFSGALSTAANLRAPLELTDLCSILFFLRGPASQVSTSIRVDEMLKSVGTLGELLTFSEAELKKEFRFTKPALLALTEALTRAGFRLPEAPPTVDVLQLEPKARQLLDRMGISLLRRLLQNSEDALRIELGSASGFEAVEEIKAKLEMLGLSLDSRGLETKIGALRLSVRSEKSLEGMGLRTLRDILARSRSELLEASRSEIIVREVVSKVESLGFRLAADH